MEEQPEQDIENRTAKKTRQPGKDCRNRKVRARQRGQDSPGLTTRIEQPAQVSQDRTVMKQTAMAK
jgi:hypothetical protein